VLRLVFRLGGLGILIAATCIGIVLFVNRFGNPARYYAAIIDKDRLIRTTPSPKIILVGGSNVALNLDGAQMEQATGLPVVNMGLHGGLGLRFMMNQVKPFLGRGDLVVLVPEYQQYLGLLNGDETLVDVLCLYPEALQYLTFPRQYLALWIRIPTAIQGQFKGYLAAGTWTHPVYNRYGFDRGGNLVAHLNEPPNLSFANQPATRKPLVPFDPEVVHDINVLAARAREVGAHVVLGYPAIPTQNYQHDAEQYNLVNERLRATISIPILSTPAEHVLPLDYFFDSPYHLNARGRQLHTQTWLAELARAALVTSRTDAFQR